MRAEYHKKQVKQRRKRVKRFPEKKPTRPPKGVGRFKKRGNVTQIKLLLVHQHNQLLYLSA